MTFFTDSTLDKIPKVIYRWQFLLTTFLHALRNQLSGTLFGISCNVMERARMSLGLFAKTRLPGATLSARESHPISLFGVLQYQRRHNSRKTEPPRRSGRKSSNRQISDGASSCMPVLPPPRARHAVKRTRPMGQVFRPAGFWNISENSEDFIADSLLVAIRRSS
jgi:hypothetical protein